MPLGDGFTAIRVWLEGRGTREDPRTVEVLYEELGFHRRALHAAQNKNRRLEQELNILRRFPVETTRESSPPSLVSARVVTIDSSPGGERLVRINKGTSFGVRAGGVALHDQDVLVGYVLADVGKTTATIRPMHSPETRPIKAVIPVPGNEGADDGSNDEERIPTISEPLLLQPDGDGWTATVPKNFEVQKGWEVRLSDEDWPRWAQGCLLGRVQELERSDDNPNWVELLISPSDPVHRLHRILVVSEGPRADPESSP
ncbi:MAG: hypothetical protein GY895_17740 [Phycisphaera sp.]|nr:hypothetical protein [Phycisphaera sp.]